jgi:hypothetical protein
VVIVDPNIPPTNPAQTTNIVSFHVSLNMPI